MKKIIMMMLLLVVAILQAADVDVPGYRIRITKVEDERSEKVKLVEFIEKSTGKVIKSINTFENNPYNFLPFDKEDRPYFEREGIANLVRYKDIPFTDFIALSDPNYLTPEFYEKMKDYMIYTATVVENASLARRGLVVIVSTIRLSMDDDIEGVSIKTYKYYNAKGEIVFSRENVMGIYPNYVTPNRKYMVARGYSPMVYFGRKLVPIYREQGAKIYNLITNEMIYENEKVTMLNSSFDNSNNEIRLIIPEKDYNDIVLRVKPEEGEVYYYKLSNRKEVIKIERFK